MNRVGYENLAENKIITIEDVLKAKPDKTLRAILFAYTVLLVLLYASETWTTTKKEEQKLFTANSGKTKLSNDSDQDGEEKREQNRNGSAI